MRNLLGRLHARRLPELLRIASAWGVPLHAESKGEVVGALYRAMTDPRTVRDVWSGLAEPERAMVLALADAPDRAPAPTLGDLAAALGVAEPAARETAIRLYRAGILAREGDDEPLPVGVAPRLMLPRELALQFRRVQDEMAAGDLARSPLRVLIELLDDPELESAAGVWGLRAVPGVARRQDITARLLRLVNDPARIDRVVHGRGKDAAAIWNAVRDAPGPLPLADVMATAGLDGTEAVTVARRRAALAELESALLVWHAYRDDGTRWLFVPAEIRSPGESESATLPPLEEVAAAAEMPHPWRHADAVAWDLLTLTRLVADARAPAWVAAEPPPRWLRRLAAMRFWFGGTANPPVGYLELLQAVGVAEGVLAIDETAHPHRVTPGPHARAWRGRPFPAQTTRLRERWLRLPRWVEGEPAGLVEVWGADWRGLRPRLLAALADAEIALQPGSWVSAESLAARIVTRFPSLLGPSFTAATARQAGEADAGADRDAARLAALSEIVALELSGPFVWFGLIEVADVPGQPRAIRLTPSGAALAARKPLPAADEGSAGRPLTVDPSGEITLHVPTPDRVWALSAFAEPVDLAAESHYRLTPDSIGAALAAGIERDQIVGFLERSGREPLPAGVAANLTSWARGYHRVRLRRAVILRVDEAPLRAPLLKTLQDEGWAVEPVGELALLVDLAAVAGASRDEDALLATLRAAGHAPQWATSAGEAAALGGAASPRPGQASLPGKP